MAAKKEHDINRSVNFRGNTYLHELCSRATPPETLREAVLKLGADTAVLNSQGVPPLGLAIQYGTPAMVAALLDCGAAAAFTTAKNQPFNALLFAVSANRADMVDLLLKRGLGTLVNLDGIETDGRTNGLPCLHLALQQRNEDIAARMIDAGAFLNNERGYLKVTPLMLAVMFCSNATITKLLNRGADPRHIHSMTGATLLHTAAERNRMAAADLLYGCGLDINATDNKGQTALHMAAEGNCQDMLAWLLRKNAALNIQTKGSRETALMIAARKNFTEVVRQLLEKKPDMLLVDAFNRTARAKSTGAFFLDNLLRTAEEEQQARENLKRYLQQKKRSTEKKNNKSGKKPKGNGGDKPA